jgi:hypothetical protein
MKRETIIHLCVYIKYHASIMLCMCRIIQVSSDNCRETCMCDLWERPGMDRSATEISGQAKPRKPSQSKGVGGG